MDAITAAVISVGMEHQAQQMNAQVALVRGAIKSDAAVLKLLEAATPNDPSSSADQSSSESPSSRGKGSILNLIA